MSSDTKTRVTQIQNIAPQTGDGDDCLVIIYATDTHALGKRYILTNEPVTVGRGHENTIVLENDSVSRKHATIQKYGREYLLRDHESTNGTYVNDIFITECVLCRSDQIKIGDTILKYLSGSDMEAQYHETIYKMMITDGLTGAQNKRFVLETLEREINRARRYLRPLTIVMFDIDRFKLINDHYGHLAGDYVLKELAQLVRSRLRPDDVVGRYGGEEFILLLPETDIRGGAIIAEDLRQRIFEHSFIFEQEIIQVTSSFGVAMLRDGADLSAFIKEADELLYIAKHKGRNCICY